MNHEQGSAVLLGIIIMMLLSVMGTTLLALSKTDIQIAINHRDGIAAQYLAEAGIQDALTELKTNQDFVKETGVENHITVTESLGITPTIGSYTVKTGPDFMTTNQNNRLITAIGVVNQAQRQVMANVTLPMAENDLIIIWKN